MDNYIILSEKKWTKSLLKNLSKKVSGSWVLIDRRINFNLENIKSINPKFIFIPHWSYYIPEEIFLNYNCIIFHETDLPFGRGGSPIQNLIELGYEKTKISAIKAVKKIDAGPVYLKEDLCLHGTAEEIFIRATKTIEQMILKISSKNIEPVSQIGDVTEFKRRKTKQSDVGNITEINKIFDYIRMLDAEGYPNAFLETKHLRLEFKRASLKSNNEIIADVRIIKK